MSAVVAATCFVGTPGARAQTAAPPAVAPVSDPPTLTLEGDGLSLVLRKAGDDGAALAGELKRGDAAFPVTAKLERKGAAETVSGAFTARGQAFAFSTQQADGDAQITLTTGGKTFKLTPKTGGPTSAGALFGPVNPLTGLPEASPGPAKPPFAAGAPAGAANATTARPAERPKTPLKLATASFPDLTMGGVTAYTILVPEGWTAEGKVEWSTGDIVYPQKSIRVTAPDKSCVAFMPALYAWYMVTDPQWIAQMQAQGLGAGLQAEQGMRPPEDLGNWVVEAAKKNKDLGNVHLIEQRRNVEAEKMMDELQKQAGLPPFKGMQMHSVAIGYDLGGVAMREELQLTLAVGEPVPGVNWKSLSWQLTMDGGIRAPEKTFAEQRALLQTVASSLRPTAKWWQQECDLLARLSRERLKNVQEQIAARAKLYDQISDDMMKKWRQEMASGDKQQHNFVNAIREREDYQNPDGTAVNLPSHYDYVYTDGKGNYLLTNSTLNKPPESVWTQMPVVK